MKAKIILTALFLFLGLTGCDKDDDTPEIEKLPPATQTGAGTFACLVNGETFKNSDGTINCFYQYVDGGYYFYIGGGDDKNIPQNLYLFTKEKEIAEGGTYPLIAKENGNAYGGGLSIHLLNHMRHIQILNIRVN